MEKQRFSSTASVLCLYASGVEVKEERLKRQKKVSIIKESWRKSSALHRRSIVFFSDVGKKEGEGFWSLVMCFISNLLRVLETW